MTEKFATGPPTTLIQNLHPSADGALVPPPANIGFGALVAKLNNDIEQMKQELLENKQKLLEHKQKLLEHEQALMDLRAQQANTLSWMIIGVCRSSLIILGDNNVCWQDEGIIDQIMLRNLLDKAQTALADACGLGVNNQRPSWLDWRSQFTEIMLADRLDKATLLLQGSSLDSSIIHQLCASQHTLSILSEKSDIRKEGDKLTHEELINVQHYTVAIEHQSRSDPEKSQALKLLLQVVKDYKQ